MGRCGVAIAVLFPRARSRVRLVEFEVGLIE
jgi:hypothetical protein